MPRRFGASGSVRASSRHQSACSAPLAHSFCPLTTIRVAVAAGGRPAGWRGRSRPRARRSPGTRSRRRGSPGRWRWRCSSVPAASSVEAAWWIDDEGEHEARGVVGGELLVEHDLLGDRHAAAPLGRPVGHGVAGAPQLLEPVPSGRRRTPRRRRRSARSPPAGGHVGARTTSRTSCPELVEARRRRASRSSPNRPVEPAPARGGRVERGRGWPTARAAGAAGAGCTATATTASSRRRTRWRRAAGG